MHKPVTLHGYHYSVYNRIARLVLHQKGVSYDVVEVNPFADLSSDYLALHPFGRVPVLVHGAFSLYETGAITRYTDRAFPGDPLQPPDPVALARMDQVISVIDNYGYWPMIRQVFSHCVFRPMAGEVSCTDQIAQGVEASRRVLSALETLAAEGQVLNGTTTLADCHFAPMLDYFVRADEGRRVLAEFPRLSLWWDRFSSTPALLETAPDMSQLPPA